MLIGIMTAKARAQPPMIMRLLSKENDDIVVGTPSGGSLELLRLEVSLMLVELEGLDASM